jgi:hypothetical protein
MAKTKRPITPSKRRPSRPQPAPPKPRPADWDRRPSFRDTMIKKED